MRSVFVYLYVACEGGGLCLHMLRSTPVVFVSNFFIRFCHTPIFQKHLSGNTLEQKIPSHGSPPLDGPHLQKAACEPQAGHPRQMSTQCMPVWQ